MTAEGKSKSASTDARTGELFSCQTPGGKCVMQKEVQECERKQQHLPKSQQDGPVSLAQDLCLQRFGFGQESYKLAAEEKVRAESK